MAYTYATRSQRLNLASGPAADLTSVFWGSFSAGRLVAIAISVRVRPATMLKWDLSGSLFACLMMLLFPSSEAVLWVFTVMAGLCMASIYPCAINLCEELISVTGVLLTIVIIGESLGDMLVPALTGNLIALVSPLAFVWVLFTALAMAALVFMTIRVVSLRSLTVRWATSEDDGGAVPSPASIAVQGSVSMNAPAPDETSRRSPAAVSGQSAPAQA